MFAEIILHRRVPGKFESFTYRVPVGAALQPGQFVTVPFRKQKLAGIVRSLHANAPAYAVRTIEDARDLALTKSQWELAAWMSKRYACPFSKVIDLFAPEKVWQGTLRSKVPLQRYSNVLTHAESQSKFDSPPVLDPKGVFKIETLLRKLIQTKTRKLLLEKTPLPRKALYGALQTLLPNGAQILTLMPEVFFARHFGETGNLFHSQMNETEKARVWESVRTGAIQHVTGTRTSVFLPFKNLAAIILDFEHFESYREIRQPKYHALEIAEQLAKIWEIPLMIASAAPRVETWFRAASGEYETFEWEEKEIAGRVSLLDMADERRRGNSGIFAEETLIQTAASLAKGEQVLFFINRTGEASAIFCPDCENILRCQVCQSALGLLAEEHMSCSVCRTQSSMPNFCPTCGNARLKTMGLGTVQGEREIKKIFGKAAVLRLDSQSVGSKKQALVTLNENLLNKTDIFIATQIIDKPLTLPRLKLICAVMPDSLLHGRDFRAGERTLQLLQSLKNLSPHGQLIIQTFLPGNSVFSALLKNKLELFYEPELQTRKKLNLPPFAHEN